MNSINRLQAKSSLSRLVNPLLDTHFALWAITDHPKMSVRARGLILAPRATVWISTVSMWGIAIKHGLDRGERPVSGARAVQYFRQADYRFLATEPEHVVAVAELAGHRQDPFDRLLVAQTLVEPMRLTTHDATVARDSDTIILV